MFSGGDAGAAGSKESQHVSHTNSPAAPSPVNPNSSSPLRTRLEIISTRIPQMYVAPFCGASAGVASGVVTCPLDVIKTKLQAQGGFSRRPIHMMETATLYRGMLGTGKMILYEDGIRGLYQGLGPLLLGYLPTWAVYLAIYDRSRNYFYDRTGSWWLSRGYASISAGACSTLVTNPIWVIKTRLMSQSLRSRFDSEGFRVPWRYSSAFDAARKMYMNEGIRSFYSGLTPALLGLSHVAIQFPLYEYLKMAITGYGIGEHPEDGRSHWIGISAATFMSKVCASTLTYPHEVLRTRLQTQQRTSPAASPEEITFRGGLEHPPDRGRPAVASSSDGMPNRPRYIGIVHTCQTILKEEGWRAFYSGIGTNLFRAIPAAMTTMLTYEYMRKLIHTLQQDGQMKLDEQAREPAY